MSAMQPEPVDAPGDPVGCFRCIAVPVPDGSGVPLDEDRQHRQLRVDHVERCLAGERGERASDQASVHRHSDSDPSMAPRYLSIDDFDRPR